MIGSTRARLALRLLPPLVMPRQFLDPEVYARVRVRSRGYIPHWEVEGGTYFVTYREVDSLPANVIERLKEERNAIRRSICGDRKPNAIEQALLAELDVGRGRCLLKTYGTIAAENLQHSDGQRYMLIAWAVMPNHVHVVFKSDQTLDRLAFSWKSYVAHRIGGEVFAREYFDRLIRDERDLERTVSYVRCNPAKAGLKQWPWVG